MRRYTEWLKMHEIEHMEHVLHQLQNKPWAAIYVAAFFFFMIALGALAFYAIQYACAGRMVSCSFQSDGRNYGLLASRWYYCVCAFGTFWFPSQPSFVWMDAEVVAHDEIIQNKQFILMCRSFL